MIDAVMGYLAQQFTEHLMTGRVHEQAANLSVTRKPTGDLYKTRDGWMVLAVMTEPQFQRLMKEVGRADALRRSALRRLADAHRQRQGAARDHRGRTEEGDLGRPGSSASPRPTCRPAACSASPRPCSSTSSSTAPCCRPVETEHGPIKVVGSGFRLEHGGGSVERPPATLGQHTDEVLGEAGYSAAEIASMREGKVV